MPRGRGRRENEITGTGPIAQWARRLRLLRHTADLTLDELSVKTDKSIATLSKAMAGIDLPTRRTSEAIVLACGGDVDEWVKLWTDTRLSANPQHVQNQPGHQGSSTLTQLKHGPYGRQAAGNWLREQTRGAQPSPIAVQTIPEFKTCVRQLKTWADDPTVRDLAQAMLTPPSTLQGYLTKDTLGELGFLYSFLEALGIEKTYVTEWVFAWRRLQHLDSEARQRVRTARDLLRAASEGLIYEMFFVADESLTGKHLRPPVGVLHEALGHSPKTWLQAAQRVLKTADTLMSRHGYPEAAAEAPEIAAWIAVEDLRNAVAQSHPILE
jgi:hypothetical protein